MRCSDGISMNIKRWHVARPRSAAQAKDGDMRTPNSTDTAASGNNRYAKDWNAYSEMWQDHYGKRYEHLGDEWCDDGSEARHWERRLLAQAAEPWLSPRTRLLEIGPGGGKWT